MPLETGQQFDRYQVVRPLGNGVSGESYEALDTLLQRKVTLKLIHPWTPLSDAIRRQFFREMQNISVLTHPSLSNILDYGDLEGQLYVARKYVTYGSLLGDQGRVWLRPPLALADALTHTRQLAQALHHLHAHGFLHGAVTLSNIVIQRNPLQASNTPALLLTDAGNALFVRRVGHPFITMLPVTAAPEQFSRRSTTASDQYALAAILYYWLSGRPPFLGTPEEIEHLKLEGILPPLNTLNPQVDTHLALVIQRALSAFPEERFPSLLSFIEQLAQTQHEAASETSNGSYAPAEAKPSDRQDSLVEAFSTLSSLPTSPTTDPSAKHTGGSLEAMLNALFQEEPEDVVQLPFLSETAPESTPEVQPEPTPEIQPQPTTPEVQPEPAPEIAPEPAPEQEPAQPDTIPTPEPAPATPPETPRPAPIPDPPLPQTVPDVPQPLPDPTTPIPEPMPETPPAPEPELPAVEPGPEIPLPPQPDIAQPLPGPFSTPEPLAQEEAPRPRTEHTDTEPLLPLPSQAETQPEVQTAPSHMLISSLYSERPFEVLLEGTEITIGRAGSSDILLDFDPLTSRHHALLQRQGDSYLLSDRRSAHGTRVNGELLQNEEQRVLHDGDQITIGQYQLVFSTPETSEVHSSSTMAAS